MLAARSAGYQRMLAREATQYCRERRGVGGLVVKHELPQLALGRMLGGSLQARALSYLALSQDAGVQVLRACVTSPSPPQPIPVTSPCGPASTSWAGAP